MKEIDKYKVQAAIDRFEKMFHEKVQKVNTRINSERFRAPASCIRDMEWYHRGLLEMGNKALGHFKEQLLDLYIGRKRNDQ
jgi:hypothetical protein